MILQPKYYAFFDVDGTIININSMFSFLRFFYSVHSAYTGQLKYEFFRFNTLLYEKIGVSRERLNKRYYKCFRNFPVKYIKLLALEWFKKEVESKSEIFYSEVLSEINKHQKSGGEIVLVSGSFYPCLGPLADFLKIKSVLATSLESEKGFYTGKILQQTIGEGKAVSIKKFLKEKCFSSNELCYAYGDHISDINMLQTVGHPCVVAKDRSLITYAKKQRWKIIIPSKREKNEK
jgi:HAD superfamily hydrolase (TIGR01490 family)